MIKVLSPTDALILLENELHNKIKREQKICLTGTKLISDNVQLPIVNLLVDKLQENGIAYKVLEKELWTGRFIEVIF